MFSFAEERVIKILGRRKLTIQAIAQKYYASKDRTLTPPMDPQNYIGRVVRRISMKCEHFELDWTIVGERINGSRTVWRKPLKSKRP